MIEPQNAGLPAASAVRRCRAEESNSVARALAASPGAACGKIVFTAEDAKEWAAKGEKVVLVRLETSPEDIEGMDACSGHPDRSRRYDLSRGCCCPRHGYLLCIRLLRYQHG